MVTLLEGDLTKYWYDKAIKANVVGCDTETSGLDKAKDKLAMFQMFIPNVGVVMVRNLSLYPRYIIGVLEHTKPRKIFHYASFDLAFLIRDYPYLQPKHIVDTKIAATLLDPKKELFIDPIKQKGSHSLRSLVFTTFGFLMDKTIATSDWFADTLTPEQLEYAAKDVEFLPPLLHSIEQQLQDRDLLNLAYAAYQHLPTRVLLDLKVGRDVYSYE